MLVAMAARRNLSGHLAKLFPFCHPHLVAKELRRAMDQTVPALR